jgi:hypothetical protein
MAGEIKPICYICQNSIESDQAWSMHQFGTGHTEYWHFKCYETNPTTLIPLSKESAINLLMWLNDSLPRERDSWIIETKAVLEAALR